MKFSTPRLRSD